jgi:hypothetical protein
MIIETTPLASGKTHSVAPGSLDEINKQELAQGEQLPSGEPVVETTQVAETNLVVEGESSADSDAEESEEEVNAEGIKIIRYTKPDCLKCGHLNDSFTDFFEKAKCHYTQGNEDCPASHKILFHYGVSKKKVAQSLAKNHDNPEAYTRESNKLMAAQRAGRVNDAEFEEIKTLEYAFVKLLKVEKAAQAEILAAEEKAKKKKDKKHKHSSSSKSKKSSKHKHSKRKAESASDASGSDSSDGS